jgi:hypothetical protein
MVAMKQIFILFSLWEWLTLSHMGVIVNDLPGSCKPILSFYLVALTRFGGVD